MDLGMDFFKTINKVFHYLQFLMLWMYIKVGMVKHNAQRKRDQVICACAVVKRIVLAN